MNKHEIICDKIQKRNNIVIIQILVCRVLLYLYNSFGGLILKIKTKIKIDI